MPAAANDPGERGGSRAARWLLAPPSCGDQLPARVPRAAPRRSSLRFPLSLPGSFASLAMVTRTDSYSARRLMSAAFGSGAGAPPGGRPGRPDTRGGGGEGGVADHVPPGAAADGVAVPHRDHGLRDGADPAVEPVHVHADARAARVAVLRPLALVPARREGLV